MPEEAARACGPLGTRPSRTVGVSSAAASANTTGAAAAAATVRIFLTARLAFLREEDPDITLT
jgi:hypothetical protein